MELYFPNELNEQIAFVCASVTALLGLWGLLFPATIMRMGAFQVGQVRPEGYAAVRAAGGQHIALGMAPILLGQDWIYLILGAVLAMAVVGRVLSCLFDRSLKPTNIAISLLLVVLSGGPLAYSLGYI